MISCDQKTKPSEEKNVQQYTCPMHPQIIKESPGACPICGMDLVPIHQHDLKLEVDTNLANLLQPSDEAIISNIKTIKIHTSKVIDTLHLNGVVNYNTNNLKTISSRLAGRIEKLYVKYNYQMVSKGQKIMEIYSPELAVAQQELLYLKNNGEVDLLNQAKTKLRLLGATEKQINEVINSGKVNYQFTVYSPVSGYIVEPSIANSSTIKPSLGNKMESVSTSSNIKNTAINIIEGQYIAIGEILFKVFNPQEVWAEFYSNKEEFSQITVGNTIIIVQKNGKSTTAKIDLLQPYFNEGQNYSVARVYLRNTRENFNIGELLNAVIIKPENSGFWVPKGAIYQLGEKNIVFLKKVNILKPKEVGISGKTKNNFLINAGLQEGDEIAENASYLIDTESFIKTN